MKNIKKESLPDYLQKFSEAQLPIILEDRPVKQVIAAAGSGKTFTVTGLVTHQVRSGKVSPDRILLLSFTRKAAGEIRERLPQDFRDSVEISTFHSFCFRHLPQLRPSMKNISIMEDDDRIRFFMKFLRERKEEAGGIPYELIIKNSERTRQILPDLHREMEEELRLYKNKNNIYEYDDLIQMVLEDFRNSTAQSAELARSYDLVIVDEFQDTDPDQLEFLKLMAPPNLTVVGDDYQAIYSFRGATVKPFLDFSRIFRSVSVYRLEENYRSLEHIVKAGNQIIKHSSRQLKKKVKSVRGKKRGAKVRAVILNPGEERLLAEILNRLYPENDPDYPETPFRILSRSNHRIRTWTEAGLRDEVCMTIHKSKGLEFPVVFLDLMGGWSGGSGMQDQDTADEEVRIAYVGLTRAKDFLVIIAGSVYTDRNPEKYMWEGMFRDLCTVTDLYNLERMLRENG